MIKCYLPLFAVFLLSGCGGEPLRSADYYMQNQKELGAELKNCRNRGIDPFGDSREAQNCRAASQAETNLYFGVKPSQTTAKQESN
ncbi:hypothetical protein BUE93_20305 [Chromobacterium amazonense]|uniref:EexN family lipoprotein n=1 Tax=Chromobacterium amazonense TaxID=1382803 RepID=A0A2S9WZ93_9NEIS|nr:EexN family lipoprotein [Chromobacterium amazonense]PRP68792.1 hypothetical protein BUE93_20305 [Chromobacterium amazonense]